MNWYHLFWLIPLVIAVAFGGAWVGWNLPDIWWRKKK